MSNFWQITSGWLLLVFIWEFWEVFQNTSFIEQLWETDYFICKLQNFNHQILFHKCFSSILYNNDKYRLKDIESPWKLSMKKLICNEVARYQPASLRKNLFHSSSFMYYAFIFLECITITSSKEDLEVCEHNFFRWKVLLLVIYLFNYDSTKSTIFMLNMAFDVLSLECSFCQLNLSPSFFVI